MTRSKEKKSPEGKVLKTDDVRFSAPNRGTKYQGIIERILALRPGETLVLDTPEELSPGVYRNRVSHAVRYAVDRRNIDPNLGKELRFRLVEGGKVGVSRTD